jgi:predicted anti-sigma-YlaC factor YlaD
MFNPAKNAMGCSAYRARLEDSLARGVDHLDTDDAELSAHLHECARCREALDDALLACKLMKEVPENEVRVSEAFVTRVMATIREEQDRVAVPAALWRPLERLASRFALVAAVVLLALSAYLVKLGPARGSFVSPPSAQAAVSSDFPQPPAAPSTPDDVLISMAERGHGI